MADFFCLEVEVDSDEVEPGGEDEARSRGGEDRPRRMRKSDDEDNERCDGEEGRTGGGELERGFSESSDSLAASVTRSGAASPELSVGDGIEAVNNLVDSSAGKAAGSSQCGSGTGAGSDSVSLANRAESEHGKEAGDDDDMAP